MVVHLVVPTAVHWDDGMADQKVDSWVELKGLRKVGMLAEMKVV